MIAGVCGGLGEYFGVDPVIVRFIFVVVTLTSGLGVPVYLVLWLIMPREGAPGSSGQQSVQHNAEELRREAGRLGKEMAQLGQQLGQEAAQIGQQISREVREVLVAQPRGQSQQRPSAGAQPPAEPGSYNFDPLTGQPLRGENPTTGETINLRPEPGAPIEQYVQPAPVPPPPPAPPAPRRGKNWRVLGIMLIGVGALIFLDQLNVNLDFVFPLVLIVAGLVMLRRR
jgi:phage shock protein C